MKPLKFLEKKIRQFNGPSKSSLVVAVSSLINSDHLFVIRKLQARVLKSKGVRLYQLAISGQDANDSPEPIGTSKLAYAIESFPILSEDTTLVQSSIHSKQEIFLPLFAALYWLETPTLQIKYPLSLIHI